MTDVTSPTDALPDLFARLASGDRSALPPAFRILHPLILRFCEKLLQRGPDADDATQQSLERIFEQIGSYDTSKPPLPWAFAIASWEIRTIRRRAWRSDQRTRSSGPDELAGFVQDPESAAMANQFIASAIELIDGLPAIDRHTLHEVLAREFAAEGAAAPDAAFRKRKERALHKIRSLLRNLGYVP
ncbi:MAG: RNA polymerase sigma factor [Polyangiaceae bacterium]